MKLKTEYFGKFFFTAIFAFVISAINISAATFTVTNTNNSGAGSLRQAVLDANAAASADTIVFDSSFNVQRTIALNPQIDISPEPGADTLTITGPGANLLTITVSNPDRTPFQNSLNNGGADTTTISGITFTQNQRSAIFNWATLNISNCVFLNNFDVIGYGTSGLGINNAATGNLTVNNSVFSGNTSTTVLAGNGGAIRNDGTATITNSTFNSNTAASGGAITNFGVLSVTGSTFNNNTAFKNNDFGGGAIFSSRDTTELTATITNCVFNGNAAPGNFGGGGAVRNGSGRMVINGSNFTGNTTLYGGGGVFNTGILTVSGSTFTGNKTTGLFASQGEGNGGAIYHQLSAQTTIADSVISGNEASNSGGGIMYGTNGGTALMTVTNSTISSNTANTETTQGGGGGGVFAEGPGVITITSSTIVGNSVNGGGGGIQCGGFSTCAINLGSSIIANNNATVGPDVSTSSSIIISQGYNLIKNPAGADITGTLTGNITGQDPKLGPLSFNGGQTRTHALLEGSPAIDAGNPTTFPATDQRGVSRPQDGDGAGGARADIGAYERRLSDVLSNNRVDFDGDGKTDVSIFRPAAGEWWYLKSSNNGNGALQFGQSTDKIVPADYTGDGKTDIAFFRPSSGFWFILRSENLSFLSFPFGANGDIPVTGDFDGDGKADPTVYRPSTNEWFILKSTGGVIITTFGTSGDVPVVGDYDGDGKSDIAIYRPSLGQWWIQRSTNGTVYAFQFGLSTDKPVQGDYTGDGRADPAFYRPSTGEWFVLRSENNSFYSVPFGTNGDQPSPGDYDGDGRFDTAVFRPSNTTWYIQRSTAGITFAGFGANGDLSVPNSFVP